MEIDRTEELARVIAECGFLPDHQATDLARAILASPVIAEIEREAEMRVVEWLLTYPPVIGLSQMAAWNTASHIERGEHRRVT